MTQVKKEVIAVCPGSFDPVTKGHVDIITRAAGMFSHVIVVVSNNPDKTPVFSTDERVSLLKKALSGVLNVTVDSFSGLLAGYARKNGATVIVKGLRAMSDYEYEFQQALTNKKLYPEAETVFLVTRAENMYLSSSLVKQIASLDGDISEFVPESILSEIRAKFRKGACVV